MFWKLAATLVAATLAVGGAGAQERATPGSAAPGTGQPAGTPANRQVVGIALEGGGALGLAHVGVLEWLEEHHIPIDRIAGTSMGALVGGMYAAGATPAEMRALALSDAFTSVFTLQTPYAASSFRRRQDRRELPEAIVFGMKHGPHLRNAVFSDRGVNEFLTTIFASYNGEELEFDRLAIPFRCVATDLNTLEPVTFAGGPLPAAVRASISIPGVFSPVEDKNGHSLVDGGIVDNLPTGVLRRELHAERVIAVHLQTSAVTAADTSSIVSVLNRAFSAGIERNVTESERLADVVIHVPVDKWSAADYGKAKELMESGYQAAERSREALLAYALDAEGWKAYLAAREGRRRGEPGVLREVKVEGGEAGAQREVKADMKPMEGRPVSAASTLSSISGIQANGEYGATWETFDPAGAGGTDSGADAGVLVTLSKDPIGPPYLLLSPELAAATSNVTRGEMNLRLVDQNLGGFGSELRATAELGYKTSFTGEYYRLLTEGGYFVQPRVGILRMPVYLWADQKRVAERFQQNLDAGLEAGRTFTPHLQVSAEWRAEDTRWSLTTGAGGGPYLSGTAQTGLLHINWDEAKSGVISPSGFRLSASAGALYHAVGSSNAPEVNVAFSRTRAWGKNIFGLGGTVNSYLRANVAQPYRFTLGGPMRLSASSIDEYRGTDMYLARSAIMHRIAALPTGLGQGLYAALIYEGGEMWSPEARAMLRQDGALGLVANTPIGLVTFGGSVGDAGRRKVFVTLGRWF
jgi:NTE family protein